LSLLLWAYFFLIDVFLREEIALAWGKPEGIKQTTCKFKLDIKNNTS
jgi:hypothetical protein